MKQHFLVDLTVDVPYPKTFIYRIEASNPGRALDFGYRKLRKEIPRKQLGAIRARCSDPIKVELPPLDKEKTVAKINTALSRVFA